MIYIFGDSFAANTGECSWVNLLDQPTQTFASNGSSEYRIWRSYQDTKHIITPFDTVIFCHTSPTRIYLKDNEPLLSRILPSHPLCDIIIGDVLAKNESRFVKLLNTIWDDAYFTDTYNLLVQDLMRVRNSRHITFFESDRVESLHTVWKKNPGNINHMSRDGNLIVADILKF